MQKNLRVSAMTVNNRLSRAPFVDLGQREERVKFEGSTFTVVNTLCDGTDEFSLKLEASMQKGCVTYESLSFLAVHDVT